jgi:hypothetical protein
MRIVNVTAVRRHFSYATVAPNGRSLDSGAESGEVPLTNMFDAPHFWRDIEQKRAQFILSDADKELLMRILDHGERKIVVAKPPKAVSAAPPKAESVAPPKEKKKATPEPVTQDKVDAGGVNLVDLQRANTVTAEAKQAESVTPTKKKKKAEPEPVTQAAGDVNLVDLQRANTITAESTSDEKKAKLSEIETFTNGPLGA